MRPSEADVVIPWSPVAVRMAFPGALPCPGCGARVLSLRESHGRSPRRTPLECGGGYSKRGAVANGLNRAAHGGVLLVCGGSSPAGHPLNFSRLACLDLPCGWTRRRRKGAPGRATPHGVRDEVLPIRRAWGATPRRSRAVVFSRRPDRRAPAKWHSLCIVSARFAQQPSAVFDSPRRVCGLRSHRGTPRQRAARGEPHRPGGRGTAPPALAGA